MSGTAAIRHERHAATGQAMSVFPGNTAATQSFPTKSQHAARRRASVSLAEVRAVLRQDPTIFAPLMDGVSPFGEAFPVSATWKQDGEALALQLMHRLNALKDDENGVTLAIA